MYYDLHVPGYQNYLANGIWHHNTGKSFFALAIAAQIAGGFSLVGTVKIPPAPVLYLDWETDQYTHDQRLKAICHALDHEPPHNIFYRRQTASLESSVANLKREVVKRGIVFTVIDSMAAARGGEPESADVTVRLFNAARSLGIPWMGIDHITKSAGATGDAKKPFGSVFSHNLARMTWGAEAEQNAGDVYKGVTFTNWKANNGRLQEKRTYRVDFHNSDSDELLGVDIREADISDFPKLAEGEELGKRIIAALRSGALDYESLGEAIGKEPLQQIRVRISQLVNSGQIVRIPNSKPVAFGLTDRAHAN